jgi:hypothetical protein
MRRSPRNLTIACNHAGLTHFGGVYFFHEFLRVLQFRRFLTRHLRYPRRNQRYSLAQMILALIYPIVLGLDRLETASFLRFNSTFQYLAGLPSFPDPQTLRRFLMQAPAAFQLQCQHLNNLLLQQLIHLPQHRSRLLFDLDSTVVPVFGHQENATVGYNPRFRGRGSYQPLLCTEANSSYLWDAQLRPGRSSSWVGSVEMLEQALAHLPSDIREVRVRADSGFGYDPVLTLLEQRAAQYAIVARVYSPLRRLLPGLTYQTVNRYWQMSECEHRLHGWPQARRFVVARKLLADEDAQTTLFTMGRYVYRVWITNLALTPWGIRRFYDGRAAMELRIRELQHDFALCKIPTRSYAANSLFLDVVRLAYNLVTAFQNICLPDPWSTLTLSRLRYNLFLLPGELTRPGNRPVLRLRPTPKLQDLAQIILRRLSSLPALN